MPIHAYSFIYYSGYLLKVITILQELMEENIRLRRIVDEYK